MTALTPQQMRELADELEGSDFEMVRIGGAALRTAADQLDAVQAWNQRDRGMFASVVLSRILTADTAPQEGRDD